MIGKQYNSPWCHKICSARRFYCFTPCWQTPFSVLFLLLIGFFIIKYNTLLRTNKCKQTASINNGMSCHKNSCLFVVCSRCGGSSLSPTPVLAGKTECPGSLLLSFIITNKSTQSMAFGSVSICRFPYTLRLFVIVNLTVIFIFTARTLYEHPSHLTIELHWINAHLSTVHWQLIELISLKPS